MFKVAIITGADRGLGAETARLAAAEGYDVCISYASDSDSAAHSVRDCEAAGRKAIAVKGDVANVADVSNLFAQCDQNLGPITLLVNDAGIVGEATTVRDLKDDILVRTSEVDVYDTVCCAREAISRMAKSKGGTGGVIHQRLFHRCAPWLSGRIRALLGKQSCCRDVHDRLKERSGP